MESSHKDLSKFLNQVKLSGVVKDIRSMDDEELDQLGQDLSLLVSEIVEECSSTFSEIKTELTEEPNKINFWR